jgi:hypothetical protein
MRGFFDAIINFFKRFFSRKDIQALIMEIVLNIIKREYGGKITAEKTMAVYQKAVDRLGKKIGRDKALAHRRRVALEVDSHTSYRIATNYVDRMERDRGRA